MFAILANIKSNKAYFALFMTICCLIESILKNSIFYNYFTAPGIFLSPIYFCVV